MLIVLVFLFAGIGAGYLARNKKVIIILSEKLLGWTIYLLLFFLGLSTAMSEKVRSNIGNLGVQVFIITAAAIGGSIIAGIYIYKRFFRDENEKQR